MTNLSELVPDIKISVNQIFGIDTEMKVDGYSKKNGDDASGMEQLTTAQQPEQRGSSSVSK